MPLRTFVLDGEPAVDESWSAANPPSTRSALRYACRGAAWRLRWALNRRPWTVALGDGTSILSSKSTRSERAYRFGYSEPEVARFLWEFLRPGMTFWDIGAHAGEYSLLAAGRLGAYGGIRALEPHPAQFDLLSQNLKRAACRVFLARKAVTDVEGSAEMVVDKATSRLRIGTQEASHEWLPTVSLDSLRDRSATVPDLIRVSVAGAERLVLDGAMRLLDLPAEEAPVWIVPYEPKSSERFGYPARYLVAEFGCCGYAVSWLTPDGLMPASLRNLPEQGTCHFVAVKREAGASA